MAIDITGPSNPRPGTTGQGTTVRSATADRAASAGNPDGRTSQDKVSLTGAASLLQRVDAQLSRSPVIDTVRVNDIRQALADGSFVSDPARVAEKLVKFELAVQNRGIDRKA
jgi:negative regulator of flagellin synthesis FlgM